MTPLFVIDLVIEGLGVIVYSPFAAEHIRAGDDYLSAGYVTGEQVRRHVHAGTIVAFGTGTPGSFRLEIYPGYPTDQFLSTSEFKLRLGVEVRDETLCFRDLYDLLNWGPPCPAQQTLSIADGFYHVTLCTNLPKSGLLGDNQRIFIFLNRLDSMPALGNIGIPILCE